MTPFATLDEIRSRTPEAIIGQSNLNHPGLTAEIRSRFGSRDWREGGVLQEPLIEAALPYVQAPETLGDLAGGLLHPSLVDALDGEGDPQRAYRFRRHQKPYAHQIKAWRLLGDQDKANSILVTSGTGSGKTECFLVPILDDLARRAAVNPGRLEGVEAIILYPLNALIASQEERLRAWTAPFKGAVRFGLYNGMMPDQVKGADAAQHPESVADRRALRAAPPPVLVTNVTMLEYMLLRAEDAPILHASQGKLRYIVLDEAHSYVGAQAAEIALLLRRVCLAFGVDPAEVRFVATSATIGQGPNVEQALHRFLADVSGAPDSQVHVITGLTQRPQLPPLADGPDAEGLSDFEMLGRSRVVRPLLEKLYSSAATWADISAVSGPLGMEPAQLALRIAKARSADGQALAPLRIHSFHRSTPGLWSCLDPACTKLRPVAWPFGAVHCESADRCGCGGPIFEIVSCQSCGEPFLDVSETSDQRLERPERHSAPDDFAFDVDGAADGAEEGEVPVAISASRDKLIAVEARLPGHRLMCVDPATGQIHDRAGAPGLISLAAYDRQSPDNCPACGTSAIPGSDLIRSLRFGAPFILGNATPLLLEGAAAPDEASDPARWGKFGGPPPMEGRQLLSFTDSRQGTARLSAKLQTNSERSHLRSVIYHAVQDAASQSADLEEIAALDQQIAVIRPLAGQGQAFAEVLRGLETSRDALTSKGKRGLTWDAMVSRLAEREEISVWMKSVWAKRDPRFEKESNLAEFLLLREFLRRPPRANTPETMGLARLRFNAIDNFPAGRTPSAFIRLGGTPQDWRDYLYLLLTFSVRGRMGVRVDRGVLHWIPPGVGAREVVFNPRVALAPWEVAWPRLRSGPLGRLPLIFVLLEQAFDCSLDEPSTWQAAHDCLAEAWNVLAPLLSEPGSSTYQLQFANASVAPVSKGWFCPITRRVLDVTFRGITPYGARTRGTPAVMAEAIEMPCHPAPFLRSSSGALRPAVREDVRAWLQADPAVQMLRARGGWSDVSDRIALFSDYFRSAEHSAQQSPQRLRRYEEAFKAGAINVLNCSTTMEMGVDIGSVSHVMMTNLPPSIANYRQRVGRAGRRGQSLSLAFTFCKDRPLDREAFRNPAGYLARSIREPRVALDSKVIVQRHVNALLFAAFVKESGGDAIKLQAGPFFGCNLAIGAAEDVSSPAVKLAAWIRRPATQESLVRAVATLTRKSILKDDPSVFEDAAKAFEQARAEFSAEWRSLQDLAAGCGGDRAAATRLGIQLKRLCQDYLLSVLASRGVLPGHGFPTDVVSFVVRGDAGRDAGQGEERSRFNAYPQRQLDVAIREYAPGSEVVLDGLVHRSSGVTLNWKRPAGPDGIKDVQALKWRWRCPRCGESGSVSNFNPDNRDCPACLAATCHWDEYLQPAGFAVDLRDDPHADADVVTFVPPEPTRVSACGEPWANLFDPSVGRRRSNRAGSVFFCNAGPTGKGYAVCLSCGRADAPAGQAHRPLLGAGDECEGSFKSFSRKENLRLGHEIRTDVFEFQPAGWHQPGGALALAVAFRETLARNLGVEPEEMGLAAEPRIDAVGAATFSIFLFDKASGGAGFAVQFIDLLAELLPDVARLLDCQVEGCERGCPSCVLTGDLTDDQAKLLDRKAALELVENHLSIEARPSTIERISDDAVFSPDVCGDITRAFERGALSCVLRLAGPIDMAALASWNVLHHIDSWVGRGKSVTIGFGEQALATLDPAGQMALRDFAHRWRVGLEVGSPDVFDNGASLIAEVGYDEGRHMLFAGRDSASSTLSEQWGRAATSPVVRAQGRSRWNGAAVALDTLLLTKNAAVRHVGGDLDGPIFAFASRAAQILKALVGEAGLDVGRDIEVLEYEDKFVRSPLVMRLCLETLGALVRGGAKTKVILKTAPLRLEDRPSLWLSDDWKREEDRAIVARGFAQSIGLDLDLRTGDFDHARRLKITLFDGKSALLLLDQGFGAWRCDRNTGFDFRAPPIDQVKRLKSVQTNVYIRGKTYVVVDAKT